MLRSHVYYVIAVLRLAANAAALAAWTRASSCRIIITRESITNQPESL